MIKKGKYLVLKFPNASFPDLHRVRVVKVFELPSGKRIVRYRYNWPFPITEDVEEKEFTTWIAKEIKGDS